MKSFEASASKIAKISERIEASSENIKTRVEELYNMSHHNKIIVSDNLICDKPMETLLSQTREKAVDTKNDYADLVKQMEPHKYLSIKTQETMSNQCYEQRIFLGDDMIDSDVKPRLSRKFIPPISKYRIKEKAALETEPADIELNVTNVRNLFETIPDDNAESKEMMDVDQELTELLDEISKSEEDKPPTSVINSLIPNSSEFEPILKFYAINAWLAGKQEKWCVKQSKILIKMLERENLVSTYKCMAKICSYTTISTRNFEKHLVYHETTLNVCNFLFYCPYCFFKGSSIKSLISHYEIHLYDRYQCSYCFYRSSNEESCFEHVKCHHKDYPTKIFECPLESSANGMDMERFQRKRKQFVCALHCSSKIIIYSVK